MVFHIQHDRYDPFVPSGNKFDYRGAFVSLDDGVLGLVWIFRNILVANCIGKPAKYLASQRISSDILTN